MVTVSNSAQLTAALRSGADVQLTSGTYSLAARSADYGGATITAVDGADVTFSRVDLRGVSNLTFDGVNFALPTATKGIIVVDSSGITIENSDISGSTQLGTKGLFVNHSDDIALLNNEVNGFATAMAFSDIDGLTVQGNNIHGASYDAMISGGVHNALYAENDIILETPQGRKHTDGMQFYNNGGSPLSDVTIRDNHIVSNHSSHGIYMGNNDAHHGGGRAAFFDNVVIEHNYIDTHGPLGIAVGETDHLSIVDNTAESVRVRYNSTDVDITGNTLHKAPTPSGLDWRPVSNHSSSWHIEDNTVVHGEFNDDAFQFIAIDHAHTF